MRQIHYLTFPTRNGHCAIAWHDAGVVRFQLPATRSDEAERLLLRRMGVATPGEANARTRDVIERATRYFDGEIMDFSDIVLDAGEQTDFFTKVYAAVRKLPWGHSTTYGALAKELGAGPEAARDVGQAMAKNPVPLIIPCHRVLAAGGKLGGFSAPGGVSAKIRMLELERIIPSPDEQAQASLF